MTYTEQEIRRRNEMLEFRQMQEEALEDNFTLQNKLIKLRRAITNSIVELRDNPNTMMAASLTLNTLMSIADEWCNPEDVDTLPLYCVHSEIIKDHCSCQQECYCRETVCKRKAILTEEEITLLVRQRAMDDSEKASPIYCEHANECPSVCPCACDCYCATRTCRAVYYPETILPPDEDF